MFSEISQRQILYDVTYIWSLRKEYKQTYMQNRNRLTGMENSLVITNGKKVGRGMLVGCGINKYKLLYIK